jgi:hypothetical protein
MIGRRFIVDKNNAKRGALQRLEEVRNVGINHQTTRNQGIGEDYTPLTSTLLHRTENINVEI